MQKLLIASCMALWPAMGMAGADLHETVPVLDERFDVALDRYDGRRGLWSTIGRTGRLMTNAAEAVFLDHGILGATADTSLPPLHVITNDGLSLRSVALPPAVLPDLRRYMEATGQGARAEKVRYASAKITTAQTWSQTYGYFEIEARMPRGKGRWPAFWLTFAGAGWPPEIDVLEAYGKGLDRPTKKDGAFNTAVFFDARDAEGLPRLDVDIENPFSPTPDAGDGEGRKPKVKRRGAVDVYNFHRLVRADTEFGADIYDNFHVYAMLWTPETISFYFGPDRASLREVFRTPTPPDVHDPMIVIANDQFTARGGFWSPREEAIPRVLDPDNDFRIRRIVVRALRPELQLDMAAGQSPLNDRSSVISDTGGDDLIAPGAGFDLIGLSGGADRLYLVRGRDQKIISGFGADDVVELEGYPFIDTKDVLSRLTQVGPDVWLPSGADPVWPQTIVFRGKQVADFKTGQFHIRWPKPLDIWAGRADRPNRPQFDDDGDGVLSSVRPGAWYRDRGKPVRMIGTSEPDRYMVANKASKIEEPIEGGIDTLITWVPFVLPENVERGVVRGRGVTLTGTTGNDRLESEAERATLSGGAGDDLYVLHPSASHTRIRIAHEPGHDRIRGLQPGDQLVLAPALRAKRSTWRLEDETDGLFVSLSETQSILLESVSRDQFDAMLAQD